MLIERARVRTLDGYGEWHHAIPKALGGLKTKENMVHLTAREHLIAHMLLPRFVKEPGKMWQALWAMVNMGEVKATGRLYEQAKIEAAKYISAANKGAKRTPEAKAKMSISRKGIKRGPCTLETKMKISAANKGKIRDPVTEEVKNKISNTMKGRPNLALKGKPWSAARRAAQLKKS